MKEVGIVAKGPGWELAPKDMKLWGVNDSVWRDEYIDLCFFMDRELFLTHDFSTDKGRKDFQEAVGLPPDTVENINNTVTKVCNERKIPVYCTKKFSDIPTSMAYPIEEIKEFFGTDYFGNSLDYMIALAIYEGHDVIHTFGLNMSEGSKYIYEKPSTTFWLGVALGYGIELHLHGDECCLLTTMNGRMYAYQEKQIMNQGHIKMQTDKIAKVGDVETKTFALDALDRMLLYHHLPESARYRTMKMVDKFKEEILLTSAEEKVIALHTDGTGKSVKFVNDSLPPKDFDISFEMIKVIKLTLEHLDKEGKIDKPLGSLYERFVLGE